MNIEDLVEKKIREAMERGDFDNLAGQGQPQNARDYFATPEDQRMAYAVLKNAGYLPAEAELLKEIGALKERLAQTTGEQERLALIRAINAKQLSYDLLTERYRRKGPARR